MPTSAERAARARKAHRLRNRRRRWLLPTVGGALAVVAVVMVLLLTGGDDDPVSSAQTVAPGTANSRPTVDLARREGGLSEGAVQTPSNAPAPPASESRSAGGNRFGLPVRAHGGVEDYFGTPRLYGRVHGGVDFSLAGLPEVPVLAACAGKAGAEEHSETLGTHLVVDCGDDWETVFGFLQAVTVQPGSVLQRGDQVGLGQPGKHLHFEIRYRGVPVDPSDYVEVPKRAPNTPTPVPTATGIATTTRLATSTRSATQPVAGPGTVVPPTSTGTPTATPTITTTPTITPTPTWTPTPTRTPIRAATATPTLPVSR